MKAFYLLLLALVPLTLASEYPPCQCAQVRCPGQQPARCRCENRAAIDCAKRCGGKPKIKKCPLPSKTSSASPTPKPTLNPICATLTGIRCPDRNQVCVDNPFIENCLIAADCPGICIGPRFCGGFANIRCPKGQVCLENPTDSCDVQNGGADCGGLCAIEEPFRTLTGE